MVTNVTHNSTGKCLWHNFMLWKQIYTFHLERPLATILSNSLSSGYIYKIIQFCCCNDEVVIDLSPQHTYLLVSDASIYERTKEEHDTILLFA